MPYQQGSVEFRKKSGIGSSETKPCCTELILELGKFLNSEKFESPKKVGSWKAAKRLVKVRQCLQHTNSLRFITWMTQANLDSKPFCGICLIPYQTYSKEFFTFHSKPYRSLKGNSADPCLSISSLISSQTRVKGYYWVLNCRVSRFLDFFLPQEKILYLC